MKRHNTKEELKFKILDLVVLIYRAGRFFFHEIYIFEGRVLIYREKSYLLCQASPIKESCPLSVAKYVSSTTECVHTPTVQLILYLQELLPRSLFSLLM